MDTTTYTVYLITNAVNGKIYVGQTTLTLARRLTKHFTAAKYTADNKRTRFQRAIVKHGKQSFTISVLQECSSEDELNAAEVKWNSDLHVTDPAVGYNMTLGGDGGERPTDEVKAIISQRLKEKYASGWTHPMKGKHHSEATKKKLHDALVGKMSGENNPMFGRHMSEETKQKMSEAHSGERNHFFGKTHSAETRAKIRAAKQNISDETRKKISESRSGIPMSDEAKQKMIATTLANTDARHEPIIQLFNEGVSRHDIAERLGFSYALVKQAIARHRKRNSSP